MTNKVPPRDTPNRDTFYLGLAFWVSRKSKDPSTQMGAVIISANNEPLGWGYNGPPKLIRDRDVSWTRPDKYEWTKHAEKNAIKYSQGDMKGATIYVTGKPCSGCMLDIISAEITRVVYYPHQWKRNTESIYAKEDAFDKTDELARLANVTLHEFDGNLNWMRDDIKFMEELGIFK